jgi:hypothetical protein
VTVSDEHIVVREPVDVMLVCVADELAEIQRAWAEFEGAVGLRGRKFYGAFDPVADTYSVCAVRRPDEDPAAFGQSRERSPVGDMPACACRASLRPSTSRSGQQLSGSRNERTQIGHVRRSSTTADAT